MWALPSCSCTVIRENSLKNYFIVSLCLTFTSVLGYTSTSNFETLHCCPFHLVNHLCCLFLICKSFWIKSFAKWINANVVYPIAVLFIVKGRVFIKRIFETVNHAVARRGAEKIKYKTSHASFPERVIFNKTSQSNNSNPMEFYFVLFTQDLQACIPGSSDPYIWETTSHSIILPDEFPCQGN